VTKDPISRALGAFGTRRAALDFGFFKLNVPGAGLALRVDLIVRRESGLVQVRASVHAPSHSGVHWRELPLPSARFHAPGRSAVLASAGASWLGPRGSLGTVGPVSWELAFQPAGPSFSPLPRFLEPLRPVDLFLASAPQVRFDGEVTVAGERHRVRDAPGMVCSYHGRRLPPRWTWISCSAFDRASVAVECLVAPTRLLGAGPEVELGYLHLRTDGAAHTVVAPLLGSVEVSRQGEDLVVTARRRGAGPTHRLVCTAPDPAWHDLGEGIRNTLVGDCAIEGVARAAGTAGLEERRAQEAQVAAPA
jgi:hypothetical protein